MQLTHSFPTAAALKKKAIAEADKYYQMVFQDNAKTMKVIETIREWLVEKTNGAVAAGARVNVNYHVENPYDYFHLTISLDTASLTPEMMKGLKRAKGKKTFPFKLTQISRQDALGLIAVQTFNAEDLTKDRLIAEGEVGVKAGIGTHLSFVFVEW